MRCPSWRMTANRVGWGPRVCADEVCDKLIRGISLTRQGVALGNSPQRIVTVTCSPLDYKLWSTGPEVTMKGDFTWQIIDRQTTTAE